jgi:hypothetical protein
MKRSPLRRVSKKRAKQNRLYAKVRKEYLEQNPVCEVCRSRLSSQIHHKRGRFGERLTEQEHFLGVCFACHNQIHHNPSWAYAKDYMIRR